MQPARIAELLAPFIGSADGEGLAANDLQRISTYIDLLLRWNARINLTAVRDPEHIVTRHFGESLFAARYLFPTRNLPLEERTTGEGKTAEEQATPELHINREGHGFSRADKVSEKERALAPEGRVADVGSGAGFPGIPLKLWAPYIALTLIESNQKKATFLRELARTLTLTDIHIQTARAEALAPAAFDVVTLRAVERFETILPVAASLVAPGGRLSLLISSAQLPKAKSSLTTLTWAPSLPIPASQSRVLAIAHRNSL